MTDVSSSVVVESGATAGWGVALMTAGSAFGQHRPERQEVPVSAEHTPWGVTLQVCVDEFGPPPAGWVADAQGRWRRFSGWMGFLGAVSALLEPAARAARQGEVGPESVE